MDTHNPLGVGAGRIGHIEVGRAVGVEAGDEARAAEGAATVALGVLLLQCGDKSASIKKKKSNLLFISILFIYYYSINFSQTGKWRLAVFHIMEGPS